MPTNTSSNNRGGRGRGRGRNGNRGGRNNVKVPGVNNQQNHNGRAEESEVTSVDKQDAVVEQIGDNDLTCNICFDSDITIYAVASCQHLVCYRCSTKSVLIGNQEKVCVTCRKPLKKVIMTRNPTKPFPKLESLAIPYRNNVWFEEPDIQQAVETLMENRSSHCTENCGVQKDWDALCKHMRTGHGLHICTLCFQNTNFFPSERKWYTRSALAKHNRSGDNDDTSYRMHPECEFCGIRYYDNDQLFCHLVKHHERCHLCERMGVVDKKGNPVNPFYDDIRELTKHFDRDHYLCTMGECRQTPLTSVFECEEHLQKHRLNKHCSDLSRVERRNNQSLNSIPISFNSQRQASTLNGNNREGSRRGGSRSGRGGRQSRVPNHQNADNYFQREGDSRHQFTPPPVPEVVSPPPEEPLPVQLANSAYFPSLSESAAAIPMSSSVATAPAIPNGVRKSAAQTKHPGTNIMSDWTNRSAANALPNDEDYPQLPTAASTSSSAFRAPSKTASAALRQNNSTTKKATVAATRPQQPPSLSDFPALGGSQLSSSGAPWKVAHGNRNVVKTSSVALNQHRPPPVTSRNPYSALTHHQLQEKPTTNSKANKSKKKKVRPKSEECDDDFDEPSTLGFVSLSRDVVSQESYQPEAQAAKNVNLITAEQMQQLAGMGAMNGFSSSTSSDFPSLSSSVAPPPGFGAAALRNNSFSTLLTAPKPKKTTNPPPGFAPSPLADDFPSLSAGAPSSSASVFASGRAPINSKKRNKKKVNQSQQQTKKTAAPTLKNLFSDI